MSRSYRSYPREFASFRRFCETVTLPKREANPTYLRLDGLTSGGNRDVAGIFRHAGSRWKVHADTHFEPLMLAYEALRSGELTDPFVVGRTQTAGNRCLELTPELRERQAGRSKYLYIYEDA